MIVPDYADFYGSSLYNQTEMSAILETETCPVKRTLEAELAVAQDRLVVLGDHGTATVLDRDTDSIVVLKSRFIAAREKRERVMVELHWHVKFHGC